MTNEPSGDGQQAEQESRPPAPASERGFPIVGLGASAGGLETFERFFTNMPPDAGIGFVIVQHLDPTHESILVELVRRYTSMPVMQVMDGTEVKPNNVYIIPPNRNMALLHGTLHLMEPVAPRGMRLPIDFFFRSLAEDQGENAICIVLSGTGSDGTLGLKAIKGEGGMAMVQDPETAKYNGMPHNALMTGLADYVLAPEDMPEQLITYIEHVFVPGRAQLEKRLPTAADTLQKIFILLRSATSHDFSQYKPNTINRRIERRMAVNQIDQFEHYLRFLQNNPGEANTLFKDMLIGVTSFFRDQEAWDALQNKAIPAILENREPGTKIRVWVPGTSTGEEAFSIAMLFREQMESIKQVYDIQIFATDIDSSAIEKARAGIYPDNIAADVSPERLQRFFVKLDTGYQVEKSIRDSVVFAEQSIIKDPPFSRLDLISCRNLLIYLGPELQQKVIPLFHYALRPDGFLFLGTSETLGKYDQHFRAVDRKNKIFQRLDIEPAMRKALDFTPPTEQETLPAPAIRPYEKRVRLQDLATRVIMEYYSPPSVIIDERYTVLYFQNRTGKYLEPVTGNANLNILQMARPGLRVPLSTAIRKAIKERKEVVYERVNVLSNGDTQLIDLIVRPISPEPNTTNLLMVIFQEIAPPVYGHETTPLSSPPVDSGDRVSELEHELHSTREYLQTTIEELETSNEELKSTNEELQSANEELQSTNEELETAKEELQSINEELITVNAELESKITELEEVNTDLNNLLSAVKVGIIYLDDQLNIQRFNTSATSLVNMIETDIGRPIGHIVTNLSKQNITQDALEVLNTLTPKITEVKTRTGQWYTLHIRPYRDSRNAINGVLLSFYDITTQKRVQERLSLLTRAVAQSQSGIMITNADGVITYANPIVTSATGYEQSELIGNKFPMLLSDNQSYEWIESGEWNTTLESGEWHGEVCIKSKDGTEGWHLTSISPVNDELGDQTHFIVVMENIEERRQDELRIRQRERLYRTLARNLPDAAVIVYDRDLRYLAVEGQAIDLVAYRRDELEGKTIYEVLPEHYVGELEPHYRAALEGQQNHFAYQATSGAEFEVTTVPVYDENGEIFAGMAVAWHVSK